MELFFMTLTTGILVGGIYALVALGITLTFRVLSFPDLTVDGSFPLGGAVAARLIFDGLDRSPHQDNTIVIVWGDHGWHLGEKLRYRKATGWHESKRVPLAVRNRAPIRQRDFHSAST